MRTSEQAGLAALTVAAALAAGLGWHGLHHTGPILSAAAGGLGVAAAASAGSSSTSGSTASTPSTKAASGGKATSGAAGGGAKSGSGSAASGASSGSGGGSQPSQGTLHATTTLLSQTQYAPYAVPVYPTRAAAAGQALDGFSLKLAPDGASAERLRVFIPGTTTAALDEVIARTDKVYFVEGSMGDDAPGIDTNGGDDGLVVTNARGYILQ